jgi:NodT family efflux transporter outer membrane factor (OMF) lipoprotein
VPLGLPSDLLRRRPDLRRAERELAAATARVGVARADRFPKFTLTGALGRSSQESGSLFESKSGFWSLGLGLDWPLFSGGRLAAEEEAADARSEQALRAWEQAVLVALQEAHDALTGFGREQERRASLEQAASAQREAAALARERHAAGLSDFLEVLDAERSLLSAEDELALSEQALAANAVRLYKALGGGWEEGAEAGGASAAP